MFLPFRSGFRSSVVTMTIAADDPAGPFRAFFHCSRSAVKVENRAGATVVTFLGRGESARVILRDRLGRYLEACREARGRVSWRYSARNDSFENELDCGEVSLPFGESSAASLLAGGPRLVFRRGRVENM
jgi:hypothetical protein